MREIVWLPALAPIEELPPYIAGVFNLRGRVVPVMDLCLRFGYTREPYRTHDQVIIIDGPEGTVGIIANEIYDILQLPAAAIDDAREYQGAGGAARYVFGEAKLSGNLAMLLDVSALLRSAPLTDELELDAPPGTSQELSRWFGTLAPEECELLRGRAHNLARTPAEATRQDLGAYAVIRLNDELFGLELELVREFAHRRKTTPVPCCPPHIVGNMNLRGDILTLADIRPALGMTMAGATSEVVVVRSGQLRLGLPATEIVGVVQISPADIAALPVASDRSGHAYCKGIATIGAAAVAILDLEKMLADRVLQVAEEVR